MTVPDEPELRIIKFPDLLGEEWRTERARQEAASRRRYRDHLVTALRSIDLANAEFGVVADAILDALFVVARVEGDDECVCSCHPKLPSSDLHDYGFDCGCRHTAEENRERFEQRLAELDAYWDSVEGQAIGESQAREDAELKAWLVAETGVTITSHGGFAPEQWWGTVDGHTFYFRERHDHWRMELDLRPSGRFYRTWTGGELDDDRNFEDREIEEGDVIAEGTTAVAHYGTTPIERARFIVGTVRDHLRQVDCDVHRHEVDDLELLCGRRLNWCPACGAPLHGGQPAPW